MIVYVCGNETEFDNISNAKIDIKNIENIDMIEIGQNIFHDENYKLKIEFHHRCVYVFFDKEHNRKNLVNKLNSYIKNDEEIRLIDQSNTKYRLLRELNSFILRCMFDTENQKNMLVNNFKKKLVFRNIDIKFKRSMSKNIFFKTELITNFNYQPVIDDFFNYR